MVLQNIMKNNFFFLILLLGCTSLVKKTEFDSTSNLNIDSTKNNAPEYLYGLNIDSMRVKRKKIF